MLGLLRSGAAEQAQTEARALRGQLRDSGDTSQWLHFLCRYADALAYLMHDVKGAQGVMEEATPLMQAVDGYLLADALAARAVVAVLTGDPRSALPDAERAVELAEQTDDPLLLVRALGPLGMAVGQSRDAVEGMAILERAADLASAAGASAEEARLRLNLSYLAGAAGDFAAHERHTRLGLAIEGAPAQLLAALQVNQGLGLGRLGDLDGAMAHGLASRRLAARAGPATEVRTGLTVAFIYLRRGEVGEARALVEQYGAAAREVHDWRVSELWGLIHEAEGSPAEALKSFQQGAVEDPIAVGCIAGAVRTAVAVGNLRVAREELERLEPLVAHWPIGEWLYEESRGWLAAGERREQDAIAHFLQAATKAPRHPRGHGCTSRPRDSRAIVTACWPRSTPSSRWELHAKPIAPAPSRASSGCAPDAHEPEPASSAPASNRSLNSSRRPNQRRNRRRAIPQPPHRRTPRRQHPLKARLPLARPDRHRRRSRPPPRPGVHGYRGAMLTVRSAGLVGRAAELERVGELIDGLLAGRAQGLLVVGVAGVGKTRHWRSQARWPRRAGSCLHAPVACR